MPLAINSIASLLAGKKDTTWEYVRKSLGGLTRGKTGLGKMMQILDLSYIHLPDHLKTCLLYVCKYKEDEDIDKKDLLMQWVAEGFVHVSADSRLDAEDEAEEYFQKLISLCMIQPGEIDCYSNEILSCRVHDIVLDLMRSKSEEANFIHVIDGLKDVTEGPGKIRRVSFQCNDKENVGILDTMTKGSLSHVRTVLLNTCSQLPSSIVLRFLEFKYVRVLELEHVWDRYSKVTVDLTCISMLFLLRYLKIRFYGVTVKLPDQIAELHQLETIYLEGTVEKYPSDIFTLPRLTHFRVGSFAALPDGIGRMKSLRTLERVCVNSLENINALGELTNLRELDISSYYFGESKEEITERGKAWHSSITRLSGSLRMLTLSMGFSPTVMHWSSTPLFLPGCRIGMLDLSGCIFERCPQSIGQLHGLYSFRIIVREVADGLSTVAGLPLLAYFRMQIYEMCDEEEKEESVVISGRRGAFQALTVLVFHCSKALLTFEEGALPKLEKLDIKFTHQRYRGFLPAIGLEHLPAPTLKQICLSVHMDLRVIDSEYKPEDLDDVEQYIENKRNHLRKLSHQSKRSFRKHHPGADILVRFENYKYDKDDNDVDEEDCYGEEDDQVACQANGPQTSPQIEAN